MKKKKKKEQTVLEPVVNTQWLANKLGCQMLTVKTLKIYTKEQLKCNKQRCRNNGMARCPLSKKEKY